MPQLLKHLTPVARKPHLCGSCGAVAVRPGERYDRSTYLFDGSVYDWVSCLACKGLASVVFDWVVDPDEGISRDDYQGWATEMTNDVVHGVAARAWLFRAGVTVPDPPINETPTSVQLHQPDALFNLTPNQTTKPAALAESIKETER